MKTKLDYINHAQQRTDDSHGYQEHEADHYHYTWSPDVTFWDEDKKSYYHNIRVDWDGTISVFISINDETAQRYVVMPQVSPHLLRHVAEIFSLVAHQKEEQEAANAKMAVWPLVEKFNSLTPDQQAAFRQEISGKSSQP